MTRDDIARERALKLHEVALSLLRVKGTVKLDGLASGRRVASELPSVTGPMGADMSSDRDAFAEAPRLMVHAIVFIRYFNLAK